MDNFIVLIASPGTTALVPLAGQISRALGAGPPRWLAENEACEMPLGAADQRLAKLLHAHVAGLPVDVALVPAAKRRKRLLVADMDSTIVAQECIDELAALAGVRPEVAAITARAMRGELEFEASLRERLALLKGLDCTVIDDLVAATPFVAGGRALVQTMKAHGAYTALVSGGFIPFTAHVAAALGFDEHRANEWVIEAGRLAGRVRQPILGRNAKIDTLKELAAKLDVPLDETLAVGDGANDIDMLSAAGLGVAFHGKSILRDKADACIDHSDLTALLYLQGYAKAEFVS